MKRLFTPVIMLAAGAVIGVLSAQYMMETENVSLPNPAGGWTEIMPVNSGLQALYGAGHFLRNGAVPPPKGSRFFVRSLDDDGNSLDGGCVVAIEGKLPQARWWVVNAATGSKRTTLDAGQAVREANGETIVSFSPSPVPGNWVTPPNSGAYELQFILHGLTDDANGAITLPRVKRLWC